MSTAARQLERSIQILEHDIHKDLESWSRMSVDGLAILTSIANATLEHRKRWLAASIEFEEAVALIEAVDRAPESAAALQADKTIMEQHAKVEDILQKMKSRIESMRSTLQKADTAIDQSRPYLLPVTKPIAMTYTSPSSPASPSSPGYSRNLPVSVTVTGQDVIDGATDRRHRIHDIVTSHRTEYDLRVQAARTVMEGRLSRDAIMLCLSIWLHEPYASVVRKKYINNDDGGASGSDDTVSQ